MRIQLTLSEPRVSRSTNVLLTADAECTLDEVVIALNEIRPGALFLEGKALHGEMRLGDSGIRNGCIINVDQPVEDAWVSDLELAVVGGPAAGTSFPLHLGETTVGRGLNADVQVPDSSLANAHFKIRVLDVDRQVVQDMQSRHGTVVEGRRITGRHELVAGEAIRAGSSLFEVRLVPVANADIQTDDGGGLVFNRPARIFPTGSSPELKYPNEPSKPEKPGFPWLQALAPLVFCVGAAILFHSPFYLMFGLMSPVLVVSSTLSSRKNGAKKYASDMKKYEESLAKVEAKIEESRMAQTRARRMAALDACNIRSIATEPRRRLWERRQHHDDFLSLRVGSADQIAHLKVATSYDDNERLPPKLPMVPVTVNLKKVGVLGVAGPPDCVRAMARWLIGQTAVMHSPSDVKLWLLTDGKAQPHWEWMRWLPHMHMDDIADAPYVNVAVDRYQRDEHVKLLLRIVAARKVAMQNREPLGAAIVVLYDGMRALRSIPAVVRLLKEGPEVGIYAIGLDDDATRLAEEGNAEVVINGDGLSGRLRVTGRSSMPTMIPDQVSGAWAAKVARALAPIQEIEGDEGERSLPSSVRFVDMLDIDLDDHRQLLTKWSYNGRSTSAPVGMNVDGVFALDIKRDGPHGLVAGTTGAGKSEFLQTLVVSLAMANRPDAMNFVLVDYKGASAFADCERLVHTVGLVTNLDGHLTERALTALDAELKRREHSLKELGAPDVDAAWERNPEAAGASGLARLMIVIDEFAELVHELPDFVTGLIRIARVGRSLGIHLILATQRPAGVVNAEMRSNTGLRIALRMEDRADSSEVIDDKDAAFISRTTPGRAYARLGGDSQLIAFQTARVAGKRKGLDTTVAAPEVITLPWTQVGRPAPRPTQVAQTAAETTDLHGLVEYINAAARDINASDPRKPWLPPLPERFVLPTEPVSDAELGQAVAYGIEDHPADQTQPLAMYNLPTVGHMAIAGTARSGRSTAMRSLAAAVARQWSPSDCHIYGLDFGNGSLLPLASLPHCGAIALRSERNRIERLVGRLIAELANRQETLASGGFGNIDEQRSMAPPMERMPYLLVLLDRWDGLTTEFGYETGSEVQTDILKLLREGPGVGLKMVISGDRQVLIDRIAAQIDHRIALRMSEKDDYRNIGVRPSAVPDFMPSGRGLRQEGGTEIQFGLLDEDPAAAAQARQVTLVADYWNARLAEAGEYVRPFRVDSLPAKLTWDEAQALPKTASRLTPLTIMAGVGGDDLQAVEVDLATDGPMFTIAGVSRAGRSTAALAMAQSALDQGAFVVAVAPKPSPLIALDGHPNVALLRDMETDTQTLQSLFEDVNVPVLVVVDDVNLIQNTNVDIYLHAIYKSRRPNFGLIVAGGTDEIRSALSGLTAEARKGRLGLIMSPQSALDGDTVGVRFNRSMLAPLHPGRGLLARHGSVTIVQLPLPKAVKANDVTAVQ